MNDEPPILPFPPRRVGEARKALARVLVAVPEGKVK